MCSDWTEETVTTIRTPFSEQERAEIIKCAHERAQAGWTHSKDSYEDLFKSAVNVLGREALNKRVLKTCYLTSTDAVLTGGDRKRLGLDRIGEYNLVVVDAPMHSASGTLIQVITLMSDFSFDLVSILKAAKVTAWGHANVASVHPADKTQAAWEVLSVMDKYYLYQPPV